MMWKNNSASCRNWCSWIKNSPPTPFPALPFKFPPCFIENKFSIHQLKFQLNASRRENLFFLLFISALWNHRRRWKFMEKCFLLHRPIWIDLSSNGSQFLFVFQFIFYSYFRLVSFSNTLRALATSVNQQALKNEEIFRTTRLFCGSGCSPAQSFIFYFAT